MVETHYVVFLLPLVRSLVQGSDENEDVVCSTPGNEGRTVQAWVNIVGRLRVSAVCFCRSDVWSSRTKALIERLR